jgi:hypothetical protein
MGRDERQVVDQLGLQSRPTDASNLQRGPRRSRRRDLFQPPTSIVRSSEPLLDVQREAFMEDLLNP